MYLQAINREGPDSDSGHPPIDNRGLFRHDAAIQYNRGRGLILGDSMPSGKDRLLNASEIAEIFQVSRDEIYKLARRGIIPAYKIGGAWRFDLGEVKKNCKCAKRAQRDDDGLNS
jgi:excisionase family DNA binding protein